MPVRLVISRPRRLRRYASLRAACSASPLYSAITRRILHEGCAEAPQEFCGRLEQNSCVSSGILHTSISRVLRAGQWLDHTDFARIGALKLCSILELNALTRGVVSVSVMRPVSSRSAYSANPVRREQLHVL